MNTVAQLCKLPKEDENAFLNNDRLLICYGSSIKQARNNKKYQQTIGTQLAFGTNTNKIKRNGRQSFRPFYDINYSQIDKNIKVPVIKENPNLNQEFQRIKNYRSQSVKKDSINTCQIIHQRRVTIQSYKIKNKIQIYGDDKFRNNFRLPMNTKELNDSLFTILQKYQVPKKRFNLMQFSI